MMKKSKMNIITKISILVILTFLILLLSNQVYAASASVSAGKTSLEIGQSTSVTVTVSSSEAWNVRISTSGGSLSGTTANADAAGSEVTQSVISATFTASSAGTYKISLSGEVTGSDLIKKSVSDSVTITVSEPAPVVTPEPEPKPEPQKPVQNNTTTNNSTTKTEVKKSSDSKLKSLSVEGYQISPEFSADIKEYKLSVPYEVTELNISASANHSKATYSVSGEEELEVGENEVIVKGRAEDGSTTVYKIIVTRAREELYLSSIIAKITDENGVIKELPLNPVFNFNVLEYALGQISHKVEKIDIEALANLEGATIEITGNENLQEGENIITITARIPKENIAEGEEVTEEVKVYTIKVNKEAEPVIVPPTMMGTIKTFFDNNGDKVLSGALVFCAVAFAGLTIYLAVDYNKYKNLTEKIAKLSNLNNEEVVEEKSVETQKIEEVREKKTGRHF